MSTGGSIAMAVDYLSRRCESLVASCSATTSSATKTIARTSCVLGQWDGRRGCSPAANWTASAKVLIPSNLELEKVKTCTFIDRLATLGLSHTKNERRVVMSWMKLWRKTWLLATGVAVVATFWNSVEAFAPAKPYVMLKDRLDRPHDGYCIDIAGSGEWIDLNVPLSAHNCKGPGIAPDQALHHDLRSGQLRFPAFNVCVTALGRAGRTLPQMPLVAQPCASPTAPMPTPFATVSLQAFDFRNDGRLELRLTGMCVTAGTRSDATFSQQDRWRALQMSPCDQAPLTLSQWQPPSPL